MEEQEFNLESLMKLNCDYDLLKQVLEYLLSRDKAISGHLSGLDKTLTDIKEEVNKNTMQHKVMGKAYPSMPEFVTLKEKVAKLEERVYSHDAKLAEHQTVIDTTSFNTKMMQMTVNDHDEKIEERNST